jgi:hypothetical protein
VHEHVARVAALLDDARDDVALLADELAVRHVVLGLAQALHDHLLGGGRRDPAEAGRGVVPLAQQLARLVHLLRPDGDVPVGAVELDAGVLGMARRALVGDEQRLLDRLDEQVEADVALTFEAAQQPHVDVHGYSSSSSWSAVASSSWLSSWSSPSGRRNSTCTRPLTTSPHARVRSVPSTSRVTPSSSQDRTRPVVSPPPARTAVTSRPVARRQCRGCVSGRSTPGRAHLEDVRHRAHDVALVEGG